MFRALRLSALASLAVGLLACAQGPQDAISDAGDARQVYSGQQCGQADDPGARWLGDQDALGGVLSGQNRTQIGFAQTEPPDVDFTREHVVSISMGQRPTGGYNLTLADKKVVVENETAMVRIDWIEPPPEAFVTQALTSPCLLLALPRGDYARLKIVDRNDRVRFELQVP